MTRASTRHLPNLERLEAREVLSSGVVNGELQYMMELVNLARTNPPEAAERIERELSDSTRQTLEHFSEDLQGSLNQIASAPRRDPVAWNSQLGEAAKGHSEDLARNQFQSHNGSDGSTLGDRLDRASYSGYNNAAENVFSYAESVDHAMEAFLLDWNQSSNPHRNTIQQSDTSRPAYNEVGLGIATWTQEKRNPFLGANDRGPTEVKNVVTQVFARRDQAGPQLLGVVFNDLDGDEFYSVGEGRGGVTIEVTNVNTGTTERVTTSSSGGYQKPIAPGRYEVIARNGSQVFGPETVEVKSANVKVDFDLSKSASGSEVQLASFSKKASTSTSAGTSTVRTQLVASAPTPTPTPTPVVSLPEPMTRSLAVSNTPAPAPASASTSSPAPAVESAPAPRTQVAAAEPAREIQTTSNSSESTSKISRSTNNATSTANTTKRTENQTAAEPTNTRFRVLTAKRALQEVLQGIEWYSPRKKFQVWKS